MCVLFLLTFFSSFGPRWIVPNISLDRQDIVYIAGLGSVWPRAMGSVLSSALCQERLSVLQLVELCSSSQAERLEEI